MRLSLGPLSLLVEGDRTSQVCFRGFEVLRGVSCALRDSDWKTVPAALTHFEVKEYAGGFSVEFGCVHECDDIHFAWQGAIEAKQEGSNRWQVVWTVDGSPLSSFERNRIGLCVLHPIAGFAGTPCTVEQIDGTLLASRFPLNIAPNTVFTSVRSIRCVLAGVGSMTLEFHGDIFETEDQRNWTDASFKTYSTPLQLDVPVQVNPGDRVRQSVRLNVQGTGEAKPGFARLHHVAEGPASIWKTEDAIAALPSIGLAMTPGSTPGSTEEQALLTMMRLSHIRTEVDFAAGSWRDDLSRALEVARGLAPFLEIALAGRMTASLLDELVACLSGSDVPVGRVLTVAGAPNVLIRQLCRALGARHFWGTCAHYAELNRARPEPDSADGVCFSITPQVHSFDSRTVMQNLAAQREAVEDVRTWWPHARVAVSPVTFHPRSGKAGLRLTKGARSIPGYDARQHGSFGVAWTLGSLCALAGAHVETVTYFETAGPIGVVNVEDPGKVGTNSTDIRVSPAYHVFADFGQFAGGHIDLLRTSDSESMVGAVLSNGSALNVLLANLSTTQREVWISPDLFRDRDRSARLRVLDSTNAAFASEQPRRFRSTGDRALDLGGDTIRLSLNPYAYARIQTERIGGYDPA